jgi:hypothetical protein
VPPIRSSVRVLVATMNLSGIHGWPTARAVVGPFDSGHPDSSRVQIGMYEGAGFVNGEGLVALSRSGLMSAAR